MESRDRLANLGLFGAAAVAWVLVGLVVTTRDPVVDPTAGVVGAVLMGLAVGLTVVPLFWLGAFARQGRMTYRGDWVRAARRSLWVGLLVAILVLLRINGVLQLPIALFLVVLVLVVEVTLSTER
jgi:hypothetical protein